MENRPLDIASRMSFAIVCKTSLPSTEPSRASWMVGKFAGSLVTFGFAIDFSFLPPSQRDAHAVSPDTVKVHFSFAVLAFHPPVSTVRTHNQKPMRTKKAGNAAHTQFSKCEGRMVEIY
jgi:hypothetical protein